MDSRAVRVPAGRPPFALVCEIEPPTRADLRGVRQQIGVLAPLASRLLIPDNHLGRAAVSGIAVAREAAALGGRSIVCLNARDRNLLGFRRDMLTAAAYGVNEFVFVRGDGPAVREGPGGLTVAAMIDEARRLSGNAAFAGTPPFRVGVCARLGPVPAWKRTADVVFAQVSFSVDAALRWRDSARLDMPVYAGVMVLASVAMARRLAAAVPDIDIPDELVRRVAADRGAGVAAACDQVAALRESGAFDGANLITLARYRETARQLTR